MAAALHVDLSIPNFGIQEYMKHGALTDRVIALVRQRFAPA
jgi:mannonate dehydratase